MLYPQHNTMAPPVFGTRLIDLAVTLLTITPSRLSAALNVQYSNFGVASYLHLMHEKLLFTDVNL